MTVELFDWIKLVRLQAILDAPPHASHLVFRDDRWSFSWWAVLLYRGSVREESIMIEQVVVCFASSSDREVVRRRSLLGAWTGRIRAISREHGVGDRLMGLQEQRVGLTTKRISSTSSTRPAGASKEGRRTGLEEAEVTPLDRPQVLVVEDDESFARVLSRIISVLGAEPVVASDGRSAVKACHSNRLALITLDIQLPDMSGLELLPKLRLLGCDLPVIIITGVPAQEVTTLGLRGGAVSFLNKPVSVRELTEHLGAVLERSIRGDGGFLWYRGLRLAIGSHRVTFCGDLVVLTPHEHDLLALLMRKRGAVVEWRELCTTIWGDYNEHVVATCYRHMSSLTGKLKKAGCVGIVRSIRKVGYTIDGHDLI